MAAAVPSPRRALWILLLGLLQAVAAGKNVVSLTNAGRAAGTTSGTGTVSAGNSVAAVTGLGKLARKFWPFDTGISFSLNGDDLPTPDWKAPVQASLATIDATVVPGEAVVVDEIAPAPTRTPEEEPGFVEEPQNVASVMYRAEQKVGKGGLLSTLATSRKNQAWVDASGAGNEWATPESESTDRPEFQGSKTNLPAESKPETFKEEYDVASDDTPDVTKGDVAGHEQMTKEDAARQRSGDVEKTQRNLRLRRARESHMNIPTAHIAATQQKQRVKKSAEQLNEEASAAAQEEEIAMPPGPEKMKAQCMSYANYLKTQDIDGSELVKVWKLTCSPAVDAGAASPAYATMCGTIGGAVAKFAPKRMWDPGAVCQAVIRCFTESGLGATPLA